MDTLPFCPVFKGNEKKKERHCTYIILKKKRWLFLEIGEKVGPFDLALIPIGAYSPRWFMSPIHCSGEDAVELHRDIKSKHSVSNKQGFLM